MKKTQRTTIPRAAAALLFLLAFAVCSSSAIAARGPRLPAPDGYVTDTAEMISPGLEAELETLIGSLDAKTTAQIAVVTVPTTEPDSIEQYAVDLFEKWGIGNKEKDNGVLLLLAPKNSGNRRVRIEVGYGLEGALNDAAAGRIIRDVMAPHCKADEFDRCVAAGAVAIISAVAGEYKYKLDKNMQLVPADGSTPPAAEPGAASGKTNGQPFRYDGTAASSRTGIPRTPAGIIKKLLSNIVGVIVVILMIILFITNPRLFFLLLLTSGRGGGWSGGDRGGFGGGFGGFGGGGSGGGGASGGW